MNHRNQIPYNLFMVHHLKMNRVTGHLECITIVNVYNILNLGNYYRFIYNYLGSFFPMHVSLPFTIIIRQSVFRLTVDDR